MYLDARPQMKRPRVKPEGVFISLRLRYLLSAASRPKGADAGPLCPLPCEVGQRLTHRVDRRFSRPPIAAIINE